MAWSAQGYKPVRVAQQRFVDEFDYLVYPAAVQVMHFQLFLRPARPAPSPVALEGFGAFSRPHPDALSQHRPDAARRGHGLLALFHQDLRIS